MLSYRDSPKVQLSNKMKELLRKKSGKNKLNSNQNGPNESELLSDVYNSHRPENTFSSTKLSHQLGSKLRSQSKPKTSNTIASNKLEEMRNKKKCKLYKQEENKEYEERLKRASKSPNVQKNQQNYLDFNSNVKSIGILNRRKNMNIN